MRVSLFTIGLINKMKERIIKDILKEINLKFKTKEKYDNEIKYLKQYLKKTDVFKGKKKKIYKIINKDKKKV